MIDPFETLGLPATMDLDAATLEARYLELSRTAHPDRNAEVESDAQVAMLARAAAINDAFRTLRDPWTRAQALCERLAPGVVAATAKLSPEFLAGAMELAEAVALAERDAAEALAERIRRALAAILADIRAALTHVDARSAARLLNEARYWQKAGADLRQKLRA
ncbi:MAG: Fe-S protein assembly co-chaperone HscB [Planctomycetes bacterium]|nr:Fe-S protein assembly co-chaperone HscB [Planctomycetota bacterium]